MGDTFIHPTRGCIFKNSKAKILFFESPILLRNPYKKLKHLVKQFLSSKLVLQFVDVYFGI